MRRSANEVRIRLDVADVSQLRWAISPAWELLASLRVLGQPGAHAVHMRWLSRHRNDPLLVDPQHQPIRDLTLHTPAHLPGFLAPTPNSPLAELEDELTTVEKTPTDIIRREISDTHPNGIPDSLGPLMNAPQAQRQRIIDDLRGYWSRAIQPAWPRMRSILERDIHHRAITMANHGPGDMLSRLHDDIHWNPGKSTLTITNRATEITNPDRILIGRGIVLVPSIFAWPRAYTKTAEPWAPVIRYPARGIGSLWEPANSSHDLTAALGTTRTRLLTLLEVPSTTDQLARTLHLAPGGISTQLHRLVSADLATKTRVGREVYYARTTRAEQLLD